MACQVCGGLGPDWDYRYVGLSPFWDKLAINYERRQLLINRKIFDYLQIRRVEWSWEEDFFGNDGPEMRFTIQDLNEPRSTVHFYLQNECDEWFAHLSVALDLR